MAITQADLDQLRSEFDAKLAAVIVEHMNTATAIGAYGERFKAMDARFEMLEGRFDTVDRQFDIVDRRFVDVDRRFVEIDRKLEGVDRRFDKLDTKIQSLSDKIDSRFGWQTAMFGGLGAAVLFADQLRGALGL